MSREPILVYLGVLVALAPFSGLPLSWLSFILPLLGVLIAFIGVTLTLRKNRASTTSHEPLTPSDA
ncbi:MAG: hypothetical protein KA104_00960 [Candidatus Pacebacteria bacterium]|nr:hypothetical protein [Candidatus Paceibacterota bacterium]